MTILKGLNILGRVKMGPLVTQTYWYAMLGSLSAGLDIYPNSITVDSSNNLYISGYSYTAAGGSDAVIAKYNSTGALQWQQKLYGASTASDSGTALKTDSSGNVYMCGYTTGGGANGQDALLVKYNSSGTLQWQKILGNANTQNANGITIDSLSNIYITGALQPGPVGGADILLAQYDTSGNMNWNYGIGVGNTQVGNAITADSSNNIYTAGTYTDPGAAPSGQCLIKTDTTGTIVWQKGLGPVFGTTGIVTAYGVITDSSGNIYTAAMTTVATADGGGPGPQNLFVAKYNSSGTVLWQKILGAASNTIDVTSISADVTGNIYVVGAVTGTQSTGGSDVFIVKYDTNGNLLWQRSFGSTHGDFGGGITIDSTGAVCIAGYALNPTIGNALTIRLPADGSLTGTYGTMVYKATTLTASSGGFTAFTTSMTRPSASLTSSTSTLTAAVSTMTNTTTTI